MKARIYTSRDGTYHKVASLEYRPTDSSIYLFIPNRNNTAGKYGKTEITGQNFRINIADLSEDADFDHFSVHGTGVEHSRLKKGEVLSREKWTPLKNLDRARHLWTLIIPDISKHPGDVLRGNNNLLIDYPSTMTGGIIDILATPKGKDLNFNVEYTENNDRSTLHIFGQAIWDVGDYRLFVFSRSSDKHLGAPERTLKISLPGDYVPLISKIAPNYVEGTVATLVYDLPPIDPKN